MGRRDTIISLVMTLVVYISIISVSYAQSTQGITMACVYIGASKGDKGIVTTGSRYSDDISNATYGIAGGLNAKWIRISVPWYVIEPTDDAWTWTALDAVIAAAVAQNVNVILVLRCMHSVFNTINSATVSSGPDSPTEWAEFVAQVVNRYKSQTVYVSYEIENEVNAPGFWNDTLGNYTSHLTNSYDTIKAENATTKVIAGSVACGFTVPATCADIKGSGHGAWLDAIIQTGDYDAVSVHNYYRSDEGVDTCVPGGNDSSIPSFYGYLHYATYLMALAGKADKLLYLTESGYDSTLGEAVQSSLLQAAWDDADSLGVDLKIYLCIRDGAQVAPFVNYGLVYTGGTKKTIWTTFNMQ